MTNTIPQTLTSEELSKLLEELKNNNRNYSGHAIGIRNYLMALLMCDAGLRVGELVQLTQKKLWFDGEPVNSIMYAWWWKDIAPGAEGFAFYNSDNTKHISKRTIHYIISRASMKSIGRTIHPHVLRHTFATRMMFVTNLRVVQQLLGHKNLSSTQIYTHPKREDLQNAVAQLE